MKREAKPCPFYGMPCEYVPMAEKADAAAARIEQLEAEIKTAIRQFEDGNRLECHRTLCTVIYGKQY